MKITDKTMEWKIHNCKASFWECSLRLLSVHDIDNIYLNGKRQFFLSIVWHVL